MTDVRCSRCRGCGKIADSDDGEPWIDWLELPLNASLAVLAGIVKPLPCPVCGGTGREPEMPEMETDEPG